MAYHCTVSRTYGAQFTSNKNKEFAQIYGFEHTTPSPYWSYNGKAKAAKKKDAKPTLKKSHDIHLVLLNIRNNHLLGTLSPQLKGEWVEVPDLLCLPTELYLYVSLILQINW